MTSNAIRICDVDLDVFEPPIVCRDIQERWDVSYIADSGSETFATTLPSYTFRTKDLDQFTDFARSYLNIETTIDTISHPNLAYGVANGAKLVNFGQPLTLTQLTTFAADGNGRQLIFNNGTGNESNVVGAPAGGQDINATGPNSGVENNLAYEILFPYRLFQTVRYLINDQEVERVEHPADCVEVKKLLYENPAKASHNGWFEGWRNVASIAYAGNRGDEWNVIDNDTTNAYFQIPIASMFGCVDGMKILRGIRHTLSLQRATDSSMWRPLENANFPSTPFSVNFHISRMKLWVPLVQPSLSALQTYESSLDKGSKAMRVFENVTEYQSNDFQSQNFSWNIVALDNKPTKAIIYIADSVNTPRHSPASKKQTENIQVSRLELKVNSKVLPVTPYELGTIGEDMRAYEDFIRLANDANYDQDAMPNIDFVAWSLSRKLFAFEMPNNDEIYENVKLNDIVLRVGFNQAPTRPIKVHCILFSEHKLEFEGVENRIRITQSKEALRSIDQ